MISSRSAYRARTNHATAVTAARAERGTWVRAAVYGSMVSASSAARRVPRAERMVTYEPAGAFQAYAARCAEGASLWVRYVEGDEPVLALPQRMTVRVVDALPNNGYAGLQVITVSILPACSRCGGPRGWDTIKSRCFRKGGGVYEADQWTNPCGHEDRYQDILTEARRTPPLVDRSARRGMGHHPGEPHRAGPFREAVELVLIAAKKRRGMHAKQAAAVLAQHGHTQAADMILRQMRSLNGHMSALQAAHYLTVEGAGRKAVAC